MFTVTHPDVLSCYSTLDCSFAGLLTVVLSVEECCAGQGSSVQLDLEDEPVCIRCPSGEQRGNQDVHCMRVTFPTDIIMSV